MKGKWQFDQERSHAAISFQELNVDTRRGRTDIQKENLLRTKTDYRTNIVYIHFVLGCHSTVGMLVLSMFQLSALLLPLLFCLVTASSSPKYKRKNAFNNLLANTGL
jgi:hypothetical protein